MNLIMSHGVDPDFDKYSQSRSLREIPKIRRPSQSGASYWSGLDVQQKQECIDYDRKRSFGEKTGWWPAGCVARRWQVELYPRIDRIQNDEGNSKWIFKRYKRHPGCTVELWMIEDGPGINWILPTIVARCIDVTIAQKTLLVLRKIRSFTDLDLGFGFLPWRDDIGLLGGSQSDKSSIEQYISLGGSSIFVASSPISPLNTWNRATLGGVLILNKQYYGLTVAHALYDAQVERNKDEAEDEFGEESDWERDFDLFQMQPGASTEVDKEQSASTVDKTVVYSGHFGKDLPASPFAASEISNFLGQLSLVGFVPEIRKASHSASYQIEKSNAAKWVSTESDWALIRIHDPRFFNPNRFVTPDRKVIVPSRFSKSPPQGDVYLATGNDRGRMSYCSGIKSGMFLPNSSKMQEMWTLDTHCCR
jgi:hypothetical protein